MRSGKHLLLFLFLIAVSCTRDKNPVDSGILGSGDGYFTLKTEKNVYTWEMGESYLYVNLYGTIRNTGNNILYSRIGDAYNMADSMLFHISENSGGHVEKFNSADNTWELNEMTGISYEGKKFVPLKPGINYSFSAGMHVLPADKVTGLFRVVVEYANERNPGDDAKIYRDYSNTFEIK